MKTKLLKKIRTIGRDQVHVYSVTKLDGHNVGMIIGFSEDCYQGLFSFGETIEQVLEKACKIYLKNNIDSIRRKYKKYSIRFKRM